MADSTAAAAASSSTTTESAAAAASSSTAKKIIILKSSDNETFEIEESAALLSETIKHMIEDDCAETGIPLPNVTSEILAQVAVYLKAHGGAEKKGGDELTKWDKQYIKEIEKDVKRLFDVILAANYLAIKGLLDLTCQATADMIKDMTPEQVREIFNIENDFTPEEEKEVRDQNAWAFEP